METLDIKTAIQIAKILAAAPEERLPMILGVFEKAEVDIEGLTELEEWKALTRGTSLIDTAEFIKGITADRQQVDGEYRIKVQDFNEFCSTKKISARCARKHLYEHGLIRTSTDKGKVNYTVPMQDPETKTTVRYVVITTE